MNEQTIINQTKIITEIDARSKSNTLRIENVEKNVRMVHEINGNIKVIVEQSRHQQEDICDLADNLKNQGNQIDALEKRQDKNARALLLRIQWLLISLLISCIFYSIWDAVIKKGVK